MELPDIFTRATFWALSNPANMPRSGMIELVEAAGLARSPLMDAVLEQPDGLFITPNAVVTNLLRRAEERAGRQPLFTRQEPPQRPSQPPRSIKARQRVKRLRAKAVPAKQRRDK